MFAIASLLDTVSDQKTRDLWELLLGQCGLFGIFTTPTPHVTWQVADKYTDQVMIHLERLSKAIGSMTVRVSGLGIFTGENPVVHLALVKTPRVMEVHQMIWAVLLDCGINQNMHYSPDQWMPHVTLAYRDITSENMVCALQGLAFKPLETEILVDNLSLIYSTESDNGITARYELRGSKRLLEI